MSTVALIVIVGLTVYGLRLSGLVMPVRLLRDRAGPLLEFVPVALLAALLTTLLVSGPNASPARIAGIAAGGLLVRRTGTVWAGILGGLATYWLVAGLT